MKAKDTFWDGLDAMADVIRHKDGYHIEDFETEIESVEEIWEGDDDDLSCN